MKSLIEHGANVNAADNYGSTPLHILLVQHRNSVRCTHGFHNGELELSEEDWHTWPVRAPIAELFLTMNLIRLLVANGGNIYAENSKGHTPLSLVQDPALKTDMVFLTRRALLLFFEAICIADIEHSDSLQRVAASADLVRYLAKLM